MKSERALPYSQRPTTVLILNQMNPDHTLPNLININFNIITLV
jgi:hypothetical protein